MRAFTAALFVAFSLSSANASADGSTLPGASGSDLARGAKTAALLDGAWSTVNQYESLLADRGIYSAGWAPALTAYAAQHLLYSTAWTALVLGESALAVLASDSFAWIGSATYRSEWMVALDLPACPRPASAGCGLGTGDFAYLQIRPRGTHWWLEAGGGSFDQRVLDDALRELGETTWVLTPLTALYELATPADAPLALRSRIGPGIFGGMLNATMQPTARGRDVFKDRPWTGLYPLQGGVGPGARAELSLVVARHLLLDGDWTVAPFVLGAGRGHASPDIAPIATSSNGLPIWRKLDLGLGYQDTRLMPFTPHLEVFAAELSNRRLDHAGYRGVMMRFDIPLRDFGN